MQTRSVLRFLHAANFRLGQVVSGVSDVPATLKQRLLEAPWQSAEAVFDQAIAHEADFVLLNGDIVPAGISQIRAMSFLLGQFEKLNQVGIEVFWRTQGSASLDEWNGCFDWPTNVHFVSNRSEITYTSNGVPLATVTGSPHERSDLFSIYLSDTSSATSSADYIAACGTDRTDSVQSGHTTHCPGATQGLNFTEPGPHGCSLIELDHNSSVSISLLETNAAVWETRPLSLSSSTAPLESALREQLSIGSNATRLVRFVLDCRDTATAIELETVNLNAIRQRIQPTSGTRDHYWVCNIEPGAGMTIASGTANDNSCLHDFRDMVHHRGEDLARSLTAQRALSSSTPQTQLLGQATRLAAELLS